MLARAQHVPNIAASERMVLHTCCDLDLAECRDVHGALHTSKDMHATIADPDVEAIVLATHETIRREPIEAAAKAGKPIYVEKPMAHSIDEAYAIADVVHESGIPYCVGHNRRNAPAIAVRINDDWWSWKGYVFDQGSECAGPMLFEMTHFTDICNWFIGRLPVRVTALEGGMLNHGAVIEYEGGALATIFMGSNGTFGYPKELYEINGGGGIVVVDHMLEMRTAGIEGAPAHKTYPMLADRHPDVGVEGGFTGYMAKKRVACDEAAAAGDPNLIFAAEPDKGHARALERFINEIRGDGPMVCGVDDALLATRVSLAAIKSVKAGRVVEMAEI